MLVVEQIGQFIQLKRLSIFNELYYSGKLLERKHDADRNHAVLHHPLTDGYGRWHCNGDPL